MTISQERVDAYAQLEAAIVNMQKVVKKERGCTCDAVLDSWLVVISELAVFDPDDPNKPDDDEEMRNDISSYSKRGSLPMMNQALAQEYLNRCQVLEIRDIL